MTDQQLEAIFKKHFEAGMVVNNFSKFKKSYPTLLKVVKASMSEVADMHEKNKTDAIRSSFV